MMSRLFTFGSAFGMTSSYWSKLFAVCATGASPTSINNGGQRYGRPPAGVVYAPFSLQLQPMEKLLLINIENDPDTVYIGFEPQTFADEKTGTGLLVIAYRADGYVDVYHDPPLRLNPEDYALLHKGLHEMVPTEFHSRHLEIGSTGLDLRIEFSDLQERAIRLRVSEQTDRATKPFSLLAPVGSSAVDPPSFPLVLLYDFYFVRRAHTEVEISIDGREHGPDKLPFPIDGRRVHFMRYSSDPFIAWWNPTFEGALEALEPDDDLQVQARGATFELADNVGYLEIAAMSAGEGGHEVRVEFNPPIPDLVSLRTGIIEEGEFRLTSDPSMGSIAGTYRVERRASEIQLQLHPSRGWQPAPDRMTLRLLYAMAKFFTGWPKTYLWEATLDPSEDGVMMESRWRRTT